MALKDVIGQENAKRILYGMLKKGRLPHALLFTGEPGVGKLFTAKNLIKTLNCPKREEIDACDTCRTCRLIDNLNFADLLFIRPEGGQIKIETIRNLIEFLNMSPYEARFKGVIIDEAERLNPSAANAFLKTLEEPSQDSIIILITEKPDMIPDTIRSRCVTLRFTPLSAEETKEVLKRHTSLSEEVTVEFLPLISGRPGIIISDTLKEYRDCLNLLNSTVTSPLREKPNHTGRQVSTVTSPLSRDSLLKILDISLVHLRDRLVAIINRETGSNHAIFLPQLLSHHQVIPPSPPIQVIIENYKKILELKQLMQFNLNLKITWNYLITLLSSY